MGEYYIIKRTECGDCHGKGYRLVDNDPVGLGIPCHHCMAGIIETCVDADKWLLERLTELRFAIDGVPSDKFETTRFADRGDI